MLEQKENFNIRLSKAMTMRNKRAIDVVNATGISESALSQYRSGTISPKRNNLIILADYLNVSPTWLMGFSVPMVDKDELENKIIKKRLEYIDTDINDSRKCKQLEKEIAELEKILRDIFSNKEENNDNVDGKTQEALKLFELYEKADPTVKIAIDTLLKKNKED